MKSQLLACVTSDFSVGNVLSVKAFLGAIASAVECEVSGA